MTQPQFTFAQPKKRGKSVRLPDKDCSCGAKLRGSVPDKYVDYVLKEWDREHGQHEHQTGNAT